MGQLLLLFMKNLNLRIVSSVNLKNINTNVQSSNEL